MAPKFKIVEIGGAETAEEAPLIPVASPSPLPSVEPSAMRILEVGAEPLPDNRGILDRIRDAAYLPAGQMVQGMLFDYGDELEAGIRGAANTVGLGSETYDEALSRIRGENKQFETENPGASLGYRAGGGILATALAGLGLKGIQAAKYGKDALAAKTALETAKNAELARKATNTALIANNAWQGLKAGGAAGTLAGFGAGEGGIGERAERALLEGLMGGAFGGGFGAVAGGVQALARTEGAQRLMQKLSSPDVQRAGERGAVTLGGEATPKNVLPVLDEAETALMTKSAVIPRDDLDEGVRRLAAALDEGSPMLPAEGIDQGALYQIARDVRNHPAGIRDAQAFLEPRTANQQTRYYEAFNRAIPTNRGASSLDNLMDLQGAMSSKVAAMEDARDKSAKVLYQKAMGATPVIKSPDVDNLIQEEPMLQAAIKQVRKFGETLDGQKVKDLPDNSLAVLRGAKGVIDDKIGKAVAQGDKQEAAQYMRIKDKLMTAINKESGANREADAFFAGESGAIARFKGGEKERGIFESILNVKEENASQIGSKLFSLKPEQIGEIKDALGDEYQEQFLAGVKGHLQTLVEKGGDGREALGKLVTSDQGRAQLKTALGAENYEKLKKFIDQEGLIRKGNKWYAEGSQTASRLQAAERRKGTISKLKSLIGSFKNPTEAADQMLSSAMGDTEDVIMKQMAELLFDPQKGRAAFDKIATYRNMREPYLEGLKSLFDDVRYRSSVAGSPAASDPMIDYIQSKDKR